MSHIQDSIELEDTKKREAARKKKEAAARKAVGPDWSGYNQYLRDIDVLIRKRFPSLGGDFSVDAFTSKEANPPYQVRFSLYHKSASADVEYSLTPHPPGTRPKYFVLDEIWKGEHPTIRTDEDLRVAVRKIMDADQKALDAQVAALSEPSPYAIGNTD